MNNNINNIWPSISSVLNGDATEKEKSDVSNWIKEDKKNRLLFNRLSNTKYNAAIEKKALDTKEFIYLKTQAKINEVNLRARLRIWKYVAAASVLLFIIAGGSLIFKTESYHYPVVESKSPAGSVTKFTLSDGSTVILNASSSISYPLNFDKKVRNVKLEGEAYFEVAKDTERPFIVETNNMKINVLGTHFNVKTYDDDIKAITTLLEGSVKVEFNNLNPEVEKSVFLHPGQQVIVDKTTLQATIVDVNPDLYASWKDGQCFFENEKFIDIVKILERRFGVTIEITSSKLENQVYSGFFGKKEGVLQILNSFKKYRNFDYRQNDTNIEIYEI